MRARELAVSLLLVGGVVGLAGGARAGGQSLEEAPGAWVPGPRLVVFEGFYNPG